MSSLGLSKEDIEDFLTEAKELLDQAENCLLKIDKEQNLENNYNEVFRAFHSIKGAAGMMGMEPLQGHLHTLETHFQSCKIQKNLSKEQVNFFLNGIDCSRKIIEGENVVFSLTFQNAQSLAPIKAEDVVKKEVGTDSSQPFFVLIDDEQDILDIVSDFLTDQNFSVKSFTSPIEAIRFIKDNANVDVVMTDMNMPKMNGMSVLKEVSNLERDLPVIFLSGFLTKEMLIEAISFGVFATLEKPYNQSAILTVCMNAAKKARLSKLLTRSINFMMYQITDLQDYLEKTNKTEIKKYIEEEMQSILKMRRELKKTKAA